VQHRIKTLLGVALVVAAVAMIAKALMGGRGKLATDDGAIEVKRLATALIGVAGGFIVGVTSVGSGSLMIVMLLLVYPRLSAKRLVGTDLVQAIPLIAAATLGHALFGSISLGLTGSLLIGSMPGVYLGARVSSRAPDAIIRPALIVVLLGSALKLLGLDTSSVASTMLVFAVVALPLWAATDAAVRPAHEWVAARRNRTAWVATLAITAPFGVGLIAAGAYVGVARRALQGSRAQPAVLAEATLSG
jgi:uncharacterized membrane protein YfcA